MTLALIAGAGGLPAHVAHAQAEPPLVAAMEGFAPAGLAPDLTFRLETLGSLLNALKARGVTQICLLGKVSRPTVDADAIDAATAPLMPRLQAAIAHGDDGALRGLIALIEEAGFAVEGAHALAPDLLPPSGVLVGEGSRAHESDAARGADIVAALGAADLGQACVVARGQALALEALPGTDWMIRSLMGPSGGARAPGLPPGGLLFKAPKPGQDLRVDMPTIGPETIRAAADARLDGIVNAADGVLMLDRAL